MGLVAVIVLGGWNWYQGQLSAAVEASNSPLIARDVPGDITVDLPSIDSQRIWADVAALSFKRYSEPDRQRAREYILSELEQAGWQPQPQPFEGGINIVARRSGADPEAGTILLAAHYDTVEQAPGADDNATGVATVLETARLLEQYATPRSLELVLFDQEETGLVGSTAYAAQLPAGEKLEAAIVMDMIGYACHTAGCQSYPPLPITPATDRGEFLGVIGDQGHADLLDSFTQPAPSAASQSKSAQLALPQVLTLSVPTLGRLTPDLMRSDHLSFWRKGIGAVLVTDTANFRNPNYHQPGDTIDTLDQDFFLGAAQIVVNATVSLLVR